MPSYVWSRQRVLDSSLYKEKKKKKTVSQWVSKDGSGLEAVERPLVSRFSSAILGKLTTSISSVTRRRLSGAAWHQVVHGAPPSGLPNVDVIWAYAHTHICTFHFAVNTKRAYFPTCMHYWSHVWRKQRPVPRKTARKEKGPKIKPHIPLHIVDNKGVCVCRWWPWSGTARRIPPSIWLFPKTDWTNSGRGGPENICWARTLRAVRFLCAIGTGGSAFGRRGAYLFSGGHVYMFHCKSQSNRIL